MKTPLEELFNSFNNLKKELNEQNLKQKNLEKVNQFLLERKKLLLEDEFYFNSLPDDKKESIYNTFTKSYETSVGTSWSKDKFYSRAYNWLFFGDENGFVAVRPQKSGLYKLVGVGGNPKSILNGFNELQSKNIPIWGMVSKDIQLMANKKGFTTPPAFLLKILYKLIPNSVFGNTDFDVNSDGSLTLKYSDVGDAVKYFIGNNEYFKYLKNNILPSMKDEFSKLPSLTKTMINKFLPESDNSLNEELLDEDITSGRVIVYHRTGKDGKSPVQGIAADGYGVGSGAYYGVGVYTTYDLESQLQPKMHTYGNIVIESKVLSMDKFLIFDYDVAKKIYGNVNYTLDNQLRLILGEKEWNNFNKNYGGNLNKIIQTLSVAQYSSEASKDFYEQFKNLIIKYLRGIVFTGSNDGKVLVSYDRKNIEPLRYTNDEGKTWTNVINKNIYQRLKAYKPGDTDMVYQHFINQLETNNFNDINFTSDYIIDNFDKLKKYINSKNIYNILKKVTKEKRDTIIDILLEDSDFINKINIDSVGVLLNFTKNPDKIIDIVTQNKNFMNSLYWDGLSLLLEYSSDPEKVINVFGDNAKDIIKDLHSIDIRSLFIHARQPEKIIKMLGERWKRFTFSLDTIDFLDYLKDTNKYNLYVDILSKDPIIGDKIKQYTKEITIPMNENLNKNNMKTPLEELFNSFNNLKKELNEQNKVNIKQKNLEKVNKFIKKKMLNEIGFDTPELAARYEIPLLKGDITTKGSSQPDKHLTNTIDLKYALENNIPRLKTAEPNISNASEDEYGPKEMGNKEFLSYSFTKNVDEKRRTYFIEKVFIYPVDGKVFDFITKSYVLENDVIARVKLGDFKEKLTLQQLNSALWKWLSEYQNVPIDSSLNETKQRNLQKVQNFIKNRKNNQ